MFFAVAGLHLLIAFGVSPMARGLLSAAQPEIVLRRHAGCERLLLRSGPPVPSPPPSPPPPPTPPPPTPPHPPPTPPLTPTPPYPALHPFVVILLVLLIVLILASASTNPDSHWLSIFFILILNHALMLILIFIRIISLILVLIFRPCSDAHSAFLPSSHFYGVPPAMRP